MYLNVMDSFQNSGVYGLISFLINSTNKDENSRVQAYELLKAGRNLAKKSKDKRLNYLPPIAFDLSRHESIYRIAALLYIELGDIEKAMDCIAYLEYYYRDKEVEPHKQFNLIKQQLINEHIDAASLESHIVDYEEKYEQEKILSNISEYGDIMPTEDLTEQKTYFRRLYRRYGAQTVITSIENDVRFNQREKAIFLIRAGRTIGGIADEGPSIESLFANKALEIDRSETVIKNSYQAYLRSADLNKISQLKDEYASII